MFIWGTIKLVVISIGIVKIRSTNGTIRLLRNVRHVLDLNRNLISLGILDDAGY